MSDQQQQPEKKKRPTTCGILFVIGIVLILVYVCGNLGLAAIADFTDRDTETPTDEKITVETKVIETPADTPVTEPIEAPTETSIPEPTLEPPSTPKTEVTLSCSDCAEEGMLINLWNEPGGLSATTKILGEFEHLTVCVLLDETTIDDFLYYKVRCDSIEGWLSHRLVIPADQTTEPDHVLIDPGTYVVGEDIEPGIYQGENVDWCFWERLSDFSGQGTIVADAVRPDEKFYVEVMETDFAFYTSCQLVSFTPKEK